MDFMDLERQRGITIQVCACSYVIQLYGNVIIEIVKPVVVQKFCFIYSQLLLTHLGRTLT